MAEYSRIAKGSFTSNGSAQMINLPFTPSIVKLVNYSSYATPAQHGIPWAYWDIIMGQGFATVGYFGGSAAMSTGIVTSNGISTFSAGLALQYGPKIQIISATAANPIVVTVSANTFNVGDVVIFEGLYQTSNTGLPQISNMPFVVSAVTSTTFSVVWPGAGSNYTALTGSPSGAYVQKVLYPFLYSPGTNFIEALTLGNTTTVTTTAPHNFVVGQEIGFRIPSAWGTTQLNTLPNTFTPGSPQYYFVTSVTNSTTFVCNAVSSGYTAFNTNQPVTSVPGLQLPQVFAVGDVNTGGSPYAGANYYPSPVVNGFSTINGPAINGAFVNNTRQGFIIGNGNAVISGTPDASSALVGANTNVIYWEAYLPDFSQP